MKKLLLALSALAAFSGSALAADLPARTYTKAPPPPPVYNWTGFYIFGGGGGGLWNADQQIVATGSNIPLTVNQRQGGSGWFGTVGAGYDWQFNSWVAGIFGDGQFGSIKGTLQDPFIGPNVGISSTQKLQDSYAAGVRFGYLVAPEVLSYVNGGYSGAHWGGSQFFDTVTGLNAGIHTNSYNRNGWFIGGGVENNLNIFGITAPGLFMKTEYRAAYYGRTTLNELNPTGLPTIGDSIRFNSWNQTISTSLVYRFNWGGPAVPHY